jgi:hypothetical protein
MKENMGKEDSEDYLILMPASVPMRTMPRTAFLLIQKRWLSRKYRFALGYSDSLFDFFLATHIPVT